MNSLLERVKKSCNYPEAERDMKVVEEALRRYYYRKNRKAPCICGADSTEIVVHKELDRGYILGVRCKVCGNVAYGRHAGRQSAISQWNFENGGEEL